MTKPQYIFELARKTCPDCKRQLKYYEPMSWIFNIVAKTGDNIQLPGIHFIAFRLSEKLERDIPRRAIEGVGICKCDNNIIWVILKQKYRNKNLCQ